MSAAAPVAPTPAPTPGSPDKKRARRTPEPAADEQPPATMAATLLQPPPTATSTAAPAGINDADTRIRLSPHEARLFELLRGAGTAAGKGTVLRVAGGWVRDKLLGRESDDVDVALDNVSGQAFAEALNEHLRAQGLETRSVGVIQANPDQSKHLETARVLVLGQWVDFTNLRTETYTEGSRIPTAAFGTAEEDAFRRDFTINALFYNLHTGHVEDYTGKGLADLLGAGGVIRTPLPALTTFLDDPLRVLRAVRFSARFALPLHGDIITAARNPDLRAALKTKVSRERVGIELEGMLSGKDARPALALEALSALGLAGTVLLPPMEEGLLARSLDPPFGEGEVGWLPLGIAGVRLANLVLWAREEGAAAAAATEGWAAAASMLRPADADEARFKPDEGVDVNVEATDGGGGSSDVILLGLTRGEGYRRPRREQRLLFLAAVLLGWGGRTWPDAKGKRVPSVQVIIREALKFRARDAEEVALFHALLPRFRALAAAGAGGGEGVQRLEAGLLLREAKELWRTGIDLACVEEMARRRLQGGDAEAGEEAPRAVLDRYSAACVRVEALGLEGVWQLKPLLDGKALIGELGLPKGPLVGKAMTEQVRWQIEHPEGTREGALEHLKAFVAAAAEAGGAGGGGNC